MESPASQGVAIQWTGGVKALLDNSQKRQSGDGHMCYSLDDDLEPTSVLEIGNRFSPPLECICPHKTEHFNVHLNPSCPHAQMSCKSHPLLPFTQADHMLSNYEVGPSCHIMDPSPWKRLDEPYAHSAEPAFNIWGGTAPLQENDAELWLDEDEQLFLVPQLESNNGPYNSHHGLQYDPNYCAHPALYNNNGYMLERRQADVMANTQAFLSSPMNKPEMRSCGEEDDFVGMYINQNGEAPCGEPIQSMSRCKSCSSMESGATGSCCTEEEISEQQFTRLGYIQDMDAVSTSAKRASMVPASSCERPTGRPFKRITPHAEAAIATALGSTPPFWQQARDHMAWYADADDDGDEQTAAATQAGEHGLELVHLLLACAEAVAWRDTALATSLLDRLRACTSYSGDSIQRVTFCFAEGLSARLATMCGNSPVPHMLRKSSTAQRKEGLLQLYQCSPYLAFGFFAANEAILQAFERKTHLHILDLGMMQKLQWPALIRALASRPEGPPSSLRITATAGAGMATIDEINQWGQELKEFASTQQVPLEFQALSETLDISVLESSSLSVRAEETLAINSVLQLHRVVKESRGSLKKVLQSLHKLGPAILTLVEQDASHNGPFFLGRFLESLHYYSAIFDSLEASLPRHSQQRMKVERLHYAEEIRNIVACEGLERVERHERGDQWRRQMSRAGFQCVPLKFMSQARMLLSLYSSDGYTLAEEKGCLILGWNNKPIILASTWRTSSSSSSGSAAKKNHSTPK